MKLKYQKRTFKKLRQELLNKALQEELEYLRKKCFPYKRQSFLLDDVEIKEKNFYKENSMENTLGLYECDEKELKHNIYVSKSSIWGCQKLVQAWYRRHYYKKLKQIIRHELIHAFVKERWEYKCKAFIIGKNRDASPIFLTILYWVGGYTSHNCLQGFKQTDLYRKLLNREFKTYKDLEEYLNNYLLKYIEVIDKLKEISNKEKFIKQEEKDYWIIQNNFQFAPRINGMEKFTETAGEDLFKKDGKISKTKMITRTWHLGCNIEPSKILELYNRKQDCKATYFNNLKQLIILPKCSQEEFKKLNIKDLKMITVKEEKNF